MGLLSVFLLVSFLWFLGEELEELLELVTVSPELHATTDVCSLQLQLQPHLIPQYVCTYFKLIDLYHS